MERDSVLRVKVLIVGADGGADRLIRSSLPVAEFALAVAANGAEMEMIAADPPDAIIVDLGARRNDRISTIKAVRQRSQAPIIALSPSVSDEERRRCVEAGANDLAAKPSEVSELPGRIRAALRRSSKPTPSVEDPVFEFEHLRIDRSTRRVWVAGRDTHLTPIEYKLLCVLVEHAGKVVTHRQLLSEVWGAEYTDDTQYVRIYMGYLRRKIEIADSGRPLLVTEPRVGYRLAV